MAARCLAVLVLVAAASRGVAGADSHADSHEDSHAKDSSRESLLSMASCVADKQAVRCLESRALRYRDQLVSEQRSFDARALGAAEEDASLKEAEELLDSVMPEGLEDAQDKTTSLGTNSRGHKLKKKIHKIIKLIKIILFIVIVKLKMVFLMFMMQTMFQFKLVAISFMILLIKKYYLWVEWKHKKEEKKAVVYYEHAQHQHHYDESDHFHDGLGGLLGGHGHHGGHVEPTAESPGWGGWWGKRSSENPAPVVTNYNNNNAGLNAQQMAYGGQLQQGQIAG